MNGKTMLLRWILILAVFPAFPALHAQVVIDTTLSTSELVSDVLLGRRIRVRNVRFAGSKHSIARFVDSSAAPLIGEGVVLTTGRTREIPGPNRRPGTGINLGERGDRSLQAIGRGPTYDAASLEFEFMAAEEILTFNFLFASEEYTEYVFSQFNDVFAFFISGPGIDGIQNLAVVPRNKAPITVNTVNHLVNGANYIDNNLFDRKGNAKGENVDHLDYSLLDALEFDGMTTLLKAQTRVMPGKVYKIRIAIADVGDGRYDSAVFLEAGSFTSLPRDPLARKEIMKTEYANVRRRYDPVQVGKAPQPVGSDWTDDEEEQSEPPVASTADVELGESDDPWKRVVEFEFDKSELDARARGKLDEAAEKLKANPQQKIRILGHTDDRGSRSYNERLSHRRAEVVQAYLRDRGVETSRTKLEWYGYDKPLETNETDSGRARNRRVEVTLE